MTTTHCELCGTDNPASDKGYTQCCNERVCDGFGRDTFAIGTMEPYAVHGRVSACCSAKANLIARSRNAGWDALHREF